MNNTNIKDLNILSKLNDFCLTPEEDAKLMANIDMEALIKGIEKAEQEIANGEGIPWREAMPQIHKEVFGE